MRYNRGIKEGYKSGLEVKVSKQLESKGITVEYEQYKIKFVQPAKNRSYTPDFKLGSFFVETKGRFTLQDRQKHLFIKNEHPDLDIRFVFQNSKQKLSKGAKTSYADWCNKNSFLYADKLIPIEWIKESKE